MTDKHLFLCPSDELYRKPARGYDRFGARTRARAWRARSAADRGIIPVDKQGQVQIYRGAIGVVSVSCTVVVSFPVEASMR